jgi:ATP-dependent Clp protease ATP-binding subunit ClpC
MNGFNFTERVRRILAMSRDEAVRLGHDYIGTEHILLGLLREGEGVASTVLQNLAIDRDDLRERLGAVVRQGRPSPGSGPDLPYTSCAKKVLELAMVEARELDHAYVGSEHLLLGLLREEKGIAAQVLVAAGLSVGAVRVETLRVLGTGVSDASAAGGATEWRHGADTRPSAVVPRRVVVLLEHDDGWTLQRELGTISEAIAFLRSRE